MRFAPESANVRALATLITIRQALRTARRERDLTLDALSERATVDRAAIHKIENVRKYPDYEPGIDTVRKIVEAMKITLGEFFTKIDGGTVVPAASAARTGDSVEDVAARFAHAVVKHLDAWPTPDDAPSAAMTTMAESQIAPEAPRSALARAASALLGEVKRQQRTAPARRRQPKRGRRETASGKRKRA